MANSGSSDNMITSKAMSFEEGWPILQREAIEKVIKSLEDGVLLQKLITSQDYVRFYTIVYNICCPNQTGPEAHKLYDHYKKTFEDYISTKVLPSLRGKEDDILLQEHVKRWNNHKIMTYWLLRFFHYLDRYFTGIKKLPTLQTTSHVTFYQLVYGEINNQVRDALISLIARDRKGEEIDHSLVKNVMDIYVEMGEGSMKYYEKEFEGAIFEATAAFYASKASQWIETTKSFEDYMLKVEESLKEEEHRISTYLRCESKNKLLEIVRQELVMVHQIKANYEAAPGVAAS